MTDEQKMRIKELRGENRGYRDIASVLGLSENTVKSFCKRNGLGGFKAKKLTAEEREHICPTCGALVPQIPGRKLKKYCSDSCRCRFWNTHLEQVNRKAFYEKQCCFCKKTFIAYGNKGRKYCSHECYVADRFGGVIV